MDSEWVKQQWQGAELGDERLTQRAIKIGEACLARPDGSLPKKFVTWADTKAAYRFFDAEEVSHESLQETHNRNVIELASKLEGIVLFIQDGSELIYNTHKSTYGLGPTADAFGQGIMIHTALAVSWENEREPEVLGIAKQTAWIRPEEKKKQQEEKESEVWLKTLEEIGRPPDGRRWVSVGDRGNDIYEYFLGAKKSGWESVVRVKHDRTIIVEGEKQKLKIWIRRLKHEAEYELELRSRGEKLGRKAKIQVSWGEAKLIAPQGKTGEEIGVTYIRAYDPEDRELEWILVTTMKVKNVQEVVKIVRMYEQRWVIEEYHKCLKTGCKIEEAQLKTGKRLLALLGMLGVVATQLLRLRDASRKSPGKPAEVLVTPEIIEIIKRKFKLEGEINLKEIWRRIAMMGGFLGRKFDGNPGWQTIWAGWLRLQDMLEGMALAKNCG